MSSSREKLCAVVSGPTGTRVVGSTPSLGKMSFGPWPSHFSASGAPKNAATSMRMMKTPLAIAILSRANRRQTCSQ
ncbi:MAG TPA: hypothetical protein VKB07_03545 [Gaiellaceae bacterium]|nr:hypothetical protein [Gaiellaceae bacterium]